MSNDYDYWFDCKVCYEIVIEVQLFRTKKTLKLRYIIGHDYHGLYHHGHNYSLSGKFLIFRYMCTPIFAKKNFSENRQQMVDNIILST